MEKIRRSLYRASAMEKMSDALRDGTNLTTALHPAQPAHQPG